MLRYHVEHYPNHKHLLCCSKLVSEHVHAMTWHAQKHEPPHDRNVDEVLAATHGMKLVAPRSAHGTQMQKIGLICHAELGNQQASQMVLSLRDLPLHASVAKPVLRAPSPRLARPIRPAA